MTRNTFTRYAGEGIAGDWTTLPCDECGLSEYGCECDIEDSDGYSTDTPALDCVRILNLLPRKRDDGRSEIGG